MKNNLRIKLMIAALGFVALCAANGYAQQQTPPMPMVGGYGTVPVTDKAIVAAANYAVKTEAKKMKVKLRLVSIQSAEQQVVAGMNYRLCLTAAYDVRNKNARIPTPIKETAQAVVYQNLKGRYSLSGWTKNGCGGGM